MDTSKITFGEMLAAASGIALLLLMSALNWFTVANDPTGLGGRNAWEAFGVIDLVLFLVALAAVVMAVARGAGVDLQALPASPGKLVAAAGLLACALIVFRLLVTPDLQIQFPSASGSLESVGAVVDRGPGIFLGLIASAGIAFGGYTAMVERSGRRDRRR